MPQKLRWKGLLEKIHMELASIKVQRKIPNKIIIVKLKKNPNFNHALSLACYTIMFFYYVFRISSFHALCLKVAKHTIVLIICMKGLAGSSELKLQNADFHL